MENVWGHKKSTFLQCKSALLHLTKIMNQNKDKMQMTTDLNQKIKAGGGLASEEGVGHSSQVTQTTSSSLIIRRPLNSYGHLASKVISRNESLKDAFDDIFLKIQKKTRIRNKRFPISLEHAKRKIRDFQKRERGFFVFGNSYFASLESSSLNRLY